MCLLVIFISDLSVMSALRNMSLNEKILQKVHGKCLLRSKAITWFFKIYIRNTYLQNPCSKNFGNKHRQQSDTVTRQQSNWDLKRHIKLQKIVAIGSILTLLISSKRINPEFFNNISNNQGWDHQRHRQVRQGIW